MEINDAALIVPNGLTLHLDDLKTIFLSGLKCLGLPCPHSRGDSRHPDTELEN
jgi:hypothetical protein